MQHIQSRMLLTAEKIDIGKVNVPIELEGENIRKWIISLNYWDKALICSVLTIAVLKTFLFNTGFVNCEGSFTSLAESINTGQVLERDVYADIQSNPIGFSLILAKFFTIFDYLGVEYNFGSRVLLGIFQFLFVLVANQILKQKTFEFISSSGRFILLLFLLLHPVVWLNTGRVTPDGIYLYVSVICLLLVILYAERFNSSYLVGILSGLVFVMVSIKTNIIMLSAILVGSFHIERFRFRIAPNFIRSLVVEKLNYIFISIFLGILAYWVLTLSFDYNLVNARGVYINLSPFEIVRNISLYATYFVLMSFPFGLIVIYFLNFELVKSHRLLSYLLTVVATLSFFVIYPGVDLTSVGELNIGGGFDGLFVKYKYFTFYPSVVVSFLFLAQAVIFLTTKTNPRLIRLLLLFIILSFIGHSVIKPVQRYLLYEFFLFGLLALALSDRVSKKFLKHWLYGFLVFLLGFNVLYSVYSKSMTDLYAQFGKEVTMRNSLKLAYSEMTCKLVGNVPTYMMSKEWKVGYCMFEYLHNENLFYVSNQNFLTNKMNFVSLAPCSSGR